MAAVQFWRWRQRQSYVSDTHHWRRLPLDVTARSLDRYYSSCGCLLLTVLLLSPHAIWYHSNPPTQPERERVECFACFGFWKKERRRWSQEKRVEMKMAVGILLCCQSVLVVSCCYDQAVRLLISCTVKWKSSHRIVVKVIKPRVGESVRRRNDKIGRFSGWKKSILTRQMKTIFSNLLTNQIDRALHLPIQIFSSFTHQ